MSAVDSRLRTATGQLLHRTAEIATEFVEGLDERHVGPRADREALLDAIGGALPDDSLDPAAVIEDLAREIDPGLMAMPGPRFFGFVIGGSLPAALAADWLVSAWDQNTGIYAATPGTAVVEEVAAGWLVDVLRLPRDASVGFTTGCQMAHFAALAAARHAVLARQGWSVEEDGLHGAPPIDVVVGGEVHVTAINAARMLGIGTRRIREAEADGQGRMRPDALRRILRDRTGPTIVCAQVGNVNTGAIDPMHEITEVVREHEGAWLHVDGAFGLWAAASPRLRHLVASAELADSWATDAHKWLNVPYDCGIVAVRDRAAHRAALGPVRAAYLLHAEGTQGDPFDWVPEYSRRARGVPVYAALRSLGRRGVAELVERCCVLARRMAERLAAEPGVEVLNDVVLNQVLVRFAPRAAMSEDADALTRAVVYGVQRDGTCWMSGTTWHGMAAMRISVSNWSTTEEDADRSVNAILRVYRSASAPDS